MDCGFLPFAMVIAGSMPLVEDNPSSPDAWRKHHDNLKKREVIQQTRAETTETNKVHHDALLKNLLAASFGELSKEQRARFLQLAVLASGVLAPGEMLCELWDQVWRGDPFRRKSAGPYYLTSLQHFIGMVFLVHVDHE